MNDKPELSWIISVYNREDVVRMVLAAVGRQSRQNFEVIIADDGSGPAIGMLVEESMRLYDFPVYHIRHGDAGWRKNIILNAAVRASKTPYLVFTDGDCLPGRDFIRDHWDQREEGKILLGRRVEMSERWTRMLTMEAVSTGKFERVGAMELLDGIRGKALRLEDGVRVRSRFIRGLINRKSKGILGSNFSLHKSDLVAINGFDELYDGPGHGEDSDIQYRLSLIGVTGKSLRNLAVQYHAYHTRTSPSEKSLSRFEEVRESGDPICKRGLERFETRDARQTSETS